MRKNLYASLLALTTAFVLLVTPLSAQTKRQNKTAPSPSNAAPQPALALVPLPASDAVLIVNLRRLLTEAIPRALGDDVARTAQVNADIERFKTQTGLDARQFDTLSVGARFTNPSPNVTKIDDIVAIARGTFNAGALVAAGRILSKGQYKLERYAGKDVHIFSINNQVKFFGILKMHVRDLAMCALDANTLAIGEPGAVRAAIDAQAGKNRVDQMLVNMATGGADQIIGFAGNAPQTLTNVDLGNPEISRSIASIRQFYGSVAMAGEGFQMLAALRTLSAPDAKNLSDTIESIRQFAPALIGMGGEKGKLAKNAIENLKVTTEGNEVQLRLQLAPGDITALRSVF